MTQTLLSIGHGYAAQAAQAHLPPEWRILGTTRSPARAQDFSDQGLSPVLWASDGPADYLCAALAKATHVIMSVSPGPGDDPALAALKDAPAPHLRWVGYLSASSVYGDTGGDWIADDAPAAPTTDRGLGRLAAEAGWTEWAQARGAGAALIRIAGIYGPGRSVFDALAEGRAQRVVKPGQVFNRIHVHDLGQIIAAAARLRATGPILASDLEPAPPQDLITHACTLLGCAPPPEVPFDHATLSPMARSFYSENKRLRPDRLAELGVRLRYPTYREGLAALKP
jgi:nucleoside-diphosphate-sugar epimerase